MGLLSDLLRFSAQRMQEDSGQALANLSGQIALPPEQAAANLLQRQNLLQDQRRAQLAASGFGGNTPAAIQIANEIARRRAMGDEEGAQLLEQTSKIYDKGIGFDPGRGQYSALPNYGQIAALLAGQKKGAEADAQNLSDLTYDPITAGAERQAQLNAQLDIEPDITRANAEASIQGQNKATQERSDQVAEPILQDMLQQNEQTFDAPYLEQLQGAAKIAGNDKQTRALDLLRQNRLNLAAPLAKALGVNPTDKDFQATLDRILDINSTKSSRRAQILQLMRQLENRKMEKQPSSSDKKSSTNWQEYFK